MGFGMISGLFWETFRWQNDAQKEKGRFVEMLVLPKVILLFSRVWASIWSAKKKEKQSGTPSWMQSRFCLHFGSILGVILGAKIVKTATWIDTMVGMRLRVPKARFSRSSKSLAAKRLTVF